jgi:hypothetical protein
LPRQIFRGSPQTRSGDFFIIFRRFAFHDIFAAAASPLPFRDTAATLFSILPFAIFIYAIGQLIRFHYADDFRH